MSSATTRRAFSLLEVLTVVAVIAVLAAIVLPVLVRAREPAKRAACVAQMRQAGMALDMYREDNGRYPEMVYGDEGARVIAPYKCVVSGYPFPQGDLVNVATGQEIPDTVLLVDVRHRGRLTYYASDRGVWKWYFRTR